eukprot:Nk52_evm7s206 gene=Nk52_evmTU7s206
MKFQESEQIHNMNVAKEKQAQSVLANPDLVEAGYPAEFVEERQSGVTKTITSMLCTMVGVGILSLPTATAACGWVVATIFLFVGAYFAGHAGFRLGYMLDHGKESGPITSYSELGYHCWGRAGRYLANFCVYGTCMGAAILYMILASQMIESVIGEGIMSQVCWSLINCALLVPFIYLKDFNTVAYVSAVGIVGSAVTVLIVIVLLFVDLGEGKTSDVNHTAFKSDMEEIANSFNTIVFSFGGAAVFPELHRVMKNPEKNFKKANTGAFSLLIVFYAPIALIGYFVLGEENLLSEATDGNIANAFDPNWAVTTMQVFLWISVMGSYIVLMLPVFRSVENSLKVESKKKPVIWRFSLRTVMFAFTWFISVLIPFFGDLLGLIGGTTITGSSFLLPIGFYFTLFFKKKVMNAESSAQKTKDVLEFACLAVIFVFALCSGIYGSIYAVKNIIDKSDTYSLF